MHRMKRSFRESSMIASIGISRLLLVLPFVVSFGNAGFIKVNKECYSIGENIPITFEITDAQPDDFIGIYHPGASMTTLPDPSGNQWIWTCGSRTCHSPDGISRAAVTYNDSLEAGTWKIVLAHNSGPPYDGIVESKSFKVPFPKTFIPLSQRRASLRPCLPVPTLHFWAQCFSAQA